MIEIISNAIGVVFGFIGACVMCYAIPFCITRGITDAKKER